MSEISYSIYLSNSMEKFIREPQVAGRFYPERPERIEKIFNQLIKRERNKVNYQLSSKQIIGVILPHAGIIYSGYQTIHFFEILSRSTQQFDTFIIVHPIHRGGGYTYASDECQVWKTPLGNIHLDEEFIDAMNMSRSASFHKFEHSAEVILPFIQKYIKYPVQIVPIGVVKQNPGISAEIAHKISEAVYKTGRKVCVIASSDFSHYVRPEIGRMMDLKVTSEILKLNPDGIFREIIENEISVCGFGPVMTLVEFAKANYPSVQTTIIAQGHSGEVHPSETVVDYISILFYC